MAPPPALPLPIAALLRRARNATDPTRRHLAAYYAWEASLRLTVAAEPPSDASTLAMPSVGHWVRAMPPRPGSLTDPALLALHALLAEVGTEQRSMPRSTNAQKLLALLPAYRNKVIGHGSTRTDAFNEGAARAFLEAIEPAWRLGVFLPPGAALLFVEAVEIDAGGARRARLVRLEGLASERERDAEVAEEVRPERVYVRNDGRFASLHPWVLFEGGDERERVLFFNGFRNAAEYLDYVTGDIVKSKALAAGFPSLDADVTAALRQEHRDSAAHAAHAPAREAEERKPGLWKAAVAVSMALVVAGAGVGFYLQSGAGARPEAAGAGAAPVEDPLVPRISEDLAVQSAFRRGIESLLEADVYAAESALVPVREKAPREPLVHAALAMIYGIEEHFEDAQRELDEAVALSRGRSDRQAGLFAIIDGAQKDPSSALAAWKEHVARHGKSFLEALLVAHYFGHKGPTAERRARFEDLVAIDRRHVITYLLESGMHLHQRRFEDALAAVGRGLELRPSSPWLMSQRGVIRMVMGEPAKAKADFEEALARKGPFSGHVAYALALLGEGTPEGEAQRKREADLLLATKNIDDRLQFMCSHGSALMRKGRMREGDALLDAAVDLARTRGREGTVLRCALWPVWFEDALGRHQRADAKLEKLAGIWEGFGLTRSDGENARVLLKQIKGMLAADRGDVATAEAALGDIGKLGRKQDDLAYRIALAKKQVVEVPDASTDDLFVQARRAHTQGRMLELAGKPAEAESAYGKLLADRLACMSTERPLDFPCGGYVADGLVRLASLIASRGADAEALRVLDALAAMWPNADQDLPVLQRAAELRKKLGRAR
ncbi:tetratricopeptide repeat protein [Polyangium aurulentum]|uniref:tetratricopeptide repeat protein n=1 Tax=Polyangium aurulentum TaxID=2567896 RepID=UPI0010AE5041|nr:hypothetical protein [Polyangium aurulentum]UQA58085.1 hypothetical protein E8A73_043620 [Polyangium aurulentum]